MIEDFESWLNCIGEYINGSPIKRRQFRIAPNDVIFAVEIELNKSLGSVSVMCVIYNVDISEIMSTLYKKNIDYSLGDHVINKIAPNGRRVPFSLSDYSESARKEFSESVIDQARIFFDLNWNLEKYIELVSGRLNEGFYTKSDLPLVNLRLALASFVIKRPWREFIDKAMMSPIDAFNHNAKRLGDILANRC